MGFPFFIVRSAFRQMHDTRIPHPRIVISSGSEKSFSFAIDQEK